jgi:hypothetical protein
MADKINKINVDIKIMTYTKNIIKYINNSNNILEYVHNCEQLQKA